MMETVAEETNNDGSENSQVESSSTEMASTSATVAPTPTPTAAPSPTPTRTSIVAPTPTVATPPTLTVAPTHHDVPRKSKRDDRKDEYVKQFMKAINAAPNIEEKMQIAIQKYAHMVDDNKKMQFYIKQSEKRHTLVMKEKDQLQLEFNKTILVKSKLENLCRELQKQNKTIKEESLLKIREEEERRKETQAKFQNTLSEITALLQQNNEKNAKLRDDNITMTEKFKNVVTQFQLREQQIEKMTKQMALEQQLADAKMMKASLEHRAERERLMAEMEGLRATVQQHRAKVMELHGTETGLRSQLAVYTDKYDEFQNALVKSNQVFGGFKEEMEKMSKKIKKLEKESLSWKKRWETSQTALLDMCGERQASEERAAGVARQLHNMQSLCRTLQGERTLLLGTLKEHNIERPPLPAPVPAPPPPPAPAQPASNAKVDAMAANCAQLRQSLAHLQSQLNVLTNKQQQQQQPEETPKPEKTKKSKSKKSKKQEVPKESESDSNAKESASESANEEKEKVAGVEAIAENIAEVIANEVTADKIVDDTKAVVAEAKSTVDKVETVVDNAVLADKPETVVGKVEIEDKVKNVTTDDKTLESLIQAINNANIDLSDLEVIGDDKIDLDDILDEDSLTKSTDTASGDASDISRDTSNEQSPKNEPKAVDFIEEITNGMKVILVTDRFGDDASVIEFTEEFNSGSKIVELTDEIANTPKIIELPDEVTPKDAVFSESSSIGIPKEVKDVANTEIKAKAISTAHVNDA